jgi:DNA-binding transcriptional LysR family regulator
MAEWTRNKLPEQKPSVEMMHMLVLLADHLPAKSVSAAAAAADSGRNSFDRHLENFKEYYGSEFLTMDSRDEWILGSAGELFVETARVILRRYDSLLTWPQAHEIVIGATPRTAATYLPVFLARYAAVVEGANQPFPQIVIREADSPETLWKRLQRGQTDFAIRGLPVTAAGEPVQAPVAGIDYFAVGEVQHPVAVTPDGPADPITMEKLFTTPRVGLLRINLDDVVATMRSSDPNFTLPRPGVLVCENHMALMALVERGVCSGLVFLPAGLKVRRPLFGRRVSDLGWSARVYVFMSRATVRPEPERSPQLVAAGWSRERYLAELQAVFADPAVQRDAMAPEYRQVAFA